MSYFGFLLRFLLVPILLLLVIAFRDHRRGRERSILLRGWSTWKAIALHAAVALVYTTPWDNYLVATRVWWYDPALVTGLTLGWVPIEEYTFFILQPVFGGLWLLFLMRRLKVSRDELRPSLRRWLPLLAGIVWLAASLMLLLDWRPGTYLALELVWALPPIMLQLAFGSDILWRHRRLLFFAIIPSTVYLSTADALAINWGTWTINPAQSLNIFVGGVLPLEELLFFLLTNTLVTFGLVLVWATTSQLRLEAFKRFVSSMSVLAKPIAARNELDRRELRTKQMQTQK
jgi:lycopene cyclase domain-containing protein